MQDKVTDAVFRMEEEDEAFAEVGRGRSARRRTSGPAPRADGDRHAGSDARTPAAGDKKAEPIRNRGEKVGRNDPCPCGSGKKYKNCHMRTAV